MPADGSTPRSLLALAAVLGVAAQSWGIAEPAAAVPGVGRSPAAAVAFVPDGRIVFAASVDPTGASGPGGLFTVPRTCPTPCVPTRLTSDPSDRDPVWSPTGRSIAFSRVVPYQPSGNLGRAIFVYDAVSGSIDRLTEQGDGLGVYDDHQPDWSPLEDQVVLLRGRYDGGDLAVVPASGGVPTIIGGPAPSPRCVRAAPKWSPDGSRLAYILIDAPVIGDSIVPSSSPPASPATAVTCSRNPRRHHVFVSGPGLDVAAESELVVPGLSASSVESVDWSPDGQRLALAANIDSNALPTAYVAPVDLLTGPTLLRNQAGFPEIVTGPLHWSPDGTFVLGSANLMLKPDGRGEVGRVPSTTQYTGMYDAQCVLGSCLTAFRIVKRLRNAGPGVVTFDYQGAVNGSIVIDAGPFDTTPIAQLVKKLPAGTHAVTESGVPAGFHLDSIECDQAGAAVDVAHRKVTVTLGSSSGVVTCTFTSSYIGPGDDQDADGLSDDYERSVSLTDPAQPDTDGDGLTDGQEVITTNTDPNLVDSDLDGLGDGTEVDGTHTDPWAPDTDGDTYADGAEVSAGTDPLDPLDPVTRPNPDNCTLAGNVVKRQLLSELDAKLDIPYAPDLHFTFGPSMTFCTNTKSAQVMAAQTVGLGNQSEWLGSATETMLELAGITIDYDAEREHVTLLRNTATFEGTFMLHADLLSLVTLVIPEGKLLEAAGARLAPKLATIIAKGGRPAVVAGKIKAAVRSYVSAVKTMAAGLGRALHEAGASSGFLRLFASALDAIVGAIKAAVEAGWKSIQASGLIDQLVATDPLLAPGAMAARFAGYLSERLHDLATLDIVFWQPKVKYTVLGNGAVRRSVSGRRSSFVSVTWKKFAASVV